MFLCSADHGPLLRPDLRIPKTTAAAAVKEGRLAIAKRREASCVPGMSGSLGGESPLCNLMEVKHE